MQRIVALLAIHRSDLKEVQADGTPSWPTPASRDSMALRLVIAGELLVCCRGGEARSSDSTTRLTARQREVLQLVAEGLSAKEVAVALKISVRTAEAHKARILESLSLQSTAELVQFAIRSGIIPIE